ncbi:cupin domain-containing protein [Halegenticoccus soli]|uniref:cupin domain-containing protein n=1 Tax=Halegenticoccus soli TaxID=1985678 RepID=UPI000C6D5258|nr:cupin domain-containing protein [Halegenticoccus soli]
MPETVSLDDLEAEPHAVVFPDAEPRTVRLRLAAGERVPAHRHPGRRVVLHVLSGRLALDLDDETYPVEAGEVIRFDGEREISPLAETDSVALVVLARGDDE